MIMGILLLVGMLAGCVKDTSPKTEQESPSLQLQDGPKEAYREALEEGGQICPEFPETERLSHLDEQVLLDSISPAVVRLENGNLFGSGVIWKMEEDAIWLVTNKHLLAEKAAIDGEEEQEYQLEVIFWDGIRGDAEVAALSKAYDLAILRVDLDALGYYTVERYFGVRWDDDSFGNLKPGDDIFTLGSADYPAGNLVYGTIGNCSVYMEGFDTEMLWAYCEVKPGMSGSGVFDERGDLIGIVCAGNDKKEAAVLPLDKILKEWEDRGY